MTAQNIRKIYFAFLAFLPCVFVPNYVVDPVLVPRTLALCGFVSILLVFLFYSKLELNGSLLKTTPFVIISCFLGNLFISGFYTEMSSESLYVISKWLVIAMFFALSALLFYHQIITYKTIISGIIVFAAIAVLAGYWDVLTIIQSQVPLTKKITSVKSLFANKNLFSSVLFLCLPFLWMALQEKNKSRKAASWVLVLAFLLIILVQTRAVWLAIALFMGIILIYQYQKNYKIIAGCAAFFLSAVILFYQFLAPHIRANKPVGAIENFLFRLSNTKTISARTEYWSNAWKMWLEQPWLGVGPGNFGKYFPKYGLVGSEIQIINGTETLQRVHNDFLTVLCETGILGLLLYLTLFGFVISRLLHLIRTAKSTQQQKNYVILLAGIIGYAVISFLDFPMERIEHQVLLFMLLAWIVAEDARNKEISLSNMRYLPIKIVFTMALFFVWWVAIFRAQGEVNTVKMYQAKAQQDWSNVIYFGQKAQSKYYQIDSQSIPIDWYLGIAYFSRGEIEQSNVHFEKAYSLAPYQIQVIHNLGTVKEQKNELDQAINLYHQALKISPKFEDALLSLAGCYYKKGQFDQAFKTIDQVNIESRNERYRKYLVKILVQEMNLILQNINNPNLSEQLAKKITKSNDILHFYSDAKKTNLSFEDYIKSYKI